MASGRPLSASALAAVLLVIYIAPGGAAPPVTSFAGTWTGDVTRNASARNVGGLGIERENAGFTIAQDASTLAVTRTLNAHSWTTTYRLDGAESPNIGFYFQRTVSTTSWNGESLVVATKDPLGDVTTVFSMEGAELKTVTTAAGLNGNPGSAWTLFYKKAG
jgi:hypothetical protein